MVMALDREVTQRNDLGPMAQIADAEGGLQLSRAVISACDCKIGMRTMH